MTTALAGRTAVVTGASRGIGLAVARALIGAGARVAMVARTADALARAAALHGSAAIALACDLSDRAAVDLALARILEEFPNGPDIVVNSAGVFTLSRLDDTGTDAFTRTLDVNLVAPFLLIRAFVPAMRARAGGHVVTIGSLADRTIFPDNGAYAASKFGVRALHESLRSELRGSGVRATLVSPGPTDTPLWDPFDPDARTGFTPRVRMLPPDAVAEAVLYALTQPAAVNVDELRLSPA